MTRIVIFSKIQRSLLLDKEDPAGGKRIPSRRAAAKEEFACGSFTPFSFCF
jgi:hypothetical protein